MEGEYQDTTPLQARLLELWLGDRRYICVVGDEDQTIYTFAGATPEHLTGFARRYPGARADQVAPYIIAHDTVIARIAERRPRREEELLAIPGIGPAKVERYGADMLAIVRAAEG